jgi:aryl-alcohol dehydrogenase-like predicted oxidoreductase
MIFRTLGKTGLKVSAISLGTWQFGGEWNKTFTQNEVDELLDTAAAGGINLIDTAECYGDHLAESLIGNYLSRRDRTKWFVATKFGHKFLGFNNRQWEMEPHTVLRQLDLSLQALKTDYIDIYQFHSGSNELFDQPNLWEVLLKQKEKGKIRFLGISISSKADSYQAINASKVGADVLQILYNRLDRRAEKDFFPYAQEQNLGVLVRVPLAGGFLTGKYKTGCTFPKTDIRSTYPTEKIISWIKEAEEIQKNEIPPGVSFSQWAIAWCLKNPIVHSVIVGCKTLDQLKNNLNLDLSGN